MLTNADYVRTLQTCVFCQPFYGIEEHMNEIEIGAFEKLFYAC